jgi:hypothetical protein
MLMDSLDHTWNRTVITYDFERQMEAAVHVGGRIHDFRIRRFIVAAKPYLLVSVTLVLLGMLFRYRRRLFLSREERILNRFYRRVERDLGLDVHRGHQGLFEIASSCDNQGVHDFAAIYAAAVYHDRKLTDSEFETLKMIVRSGFRPRTS